MDRASAGSVDFVVKLLVNKVIQSHCHL